MSRTYIEVTYIDPNVCFECGAPATERHHIVPASLGGTKTIPLCGTCHAKVHDISGQRRNQLAELTKKSLEKRKELIEKNGGFYSKHGKWVTRLGGNTDTSAANAASARASKAAREKWLKESEVSKYVLARWMEGISFMDILRDLEKMYATTPNVYCSREGKQIGKGQLSKMISFYKEWKKDYMPQTPPNITKEEWLKESEVGKYVLAKLMEGLAFKEILHNLDEMYAKHPTVYCSRTGKQISSWQLYEMIAFYKEWKKDYMSKTTKEEWLKESEVGKYVLAKLMEGLAFKEILHNLEEMYAKHPTTYCSRAGKKISSSQLYEIIAFLKKLKIDSIA